MKTLLNPLHRTEIVERIGRLRPDSARGWGSMSAHQMVCHLTDAIATMLGDREAADMSTLFTRTLLRYGAVTAPVNWPKDFMTMPEANQDIGGTPPDEFQRDVARLKTAIDAFVERLDPASMRHPILGRMSRAEWGRWGYRHLAHHARQFGL